MANNRLLLGGMAAVTALIGSAAVASLPPVLALAGTEPVPAAEPASPPPPPDWSKVQIRNVANNGAILPWGGIMNDGQYVDMIAVGYGLAQQWQMVPSGTTAKGQAYQLKNRKNLTKCLEARKNPGSAGNGRYDTWIQPCDPDPDRDQKWVPVVSPQQSSHYQIFSAKYPDRAMTPDVPTANNVGLWLRPPEHTNAFSWTIDKVY
ncbi:RICIN domain-containing protein [Actinomadura algeriensis]|uniref:Ricin B lectin domain-containing protein n=1 Tax=Actinomadura algeriensis TaxID=1679523 RepID=A0ABR9K0M6_9ACTN|nr:RICIN domain-containing protein [Actinomadura algeriensis]MBE1536375.1 hypothetical protein [Actinomadura algeriensis]